MKKIVLLLVALVASMLAIPTPAVAHNGSCAEYFETSRKFTHHERTPVTLDLEWSLRLKYKSCFNDGAIHFHPINFRLMIERTGDLRCDGVSGPPDSFREFRMNPSNIGRWDFAERTFDCVGGENRYVKWIEFAGLESDRIIGWGGDRCFQFHWQVDQPLIADPDGLSPNVCI